MGNGLKTLGEEPASLRQQMRAATAPLHDALDAAMGPLGMADGPDYARFLQIQHSARLPIESWLQSRCNPADLPPVQSALLEQDLRELGHAPAPPAPFSPSAKADVLGAIWVLAGSSLGNRVILKRRREAGFVSANRFLADEAMPAFFNRLRPRLDQGVGPQDAAPAIASAHCVFETFLTLVQRAPVRVAA